MDNSEADGVLGRGAFGIVCKVTVDGTERARKEVQRRVKDQPVAAILREVRLLTLCQGLPNIIQLLVLT